jgi:transposase
VWNVLSDRKFELLVADAKHIKNVHGRKTDMNDAMWIADLVSFGLIKASFVPEQDMQELRSLLRTRKQLTREQTRHVQRIQTTLEEANIKLDSVISDIMGSQNRYADHSDPSGVCHVSTSPSRRSLSSHAALSTGSMASAEQAARYGIARRKSLAALAPRLHPRALRPACSSA